MEMELIDEYDEDDVDNSYLQSTPACFIIFGKPFCGKSTLAFKLAEKWRCPLINVETLKTSLSNTTSNKELDIAFEEENLDVFKKGTDSQNDVIVSDETIFHLFEEKMLSPQLANLGYIIDDFPSLFGKAKKFREQLQFIDNLKLKPNIIIHIKMPNEDVIRRKSNSKLNSKTGRFHVREEFDPWPRVEKPLSLVNNEMLEIALQDEPDKDSGKDDSSSDGNKDGYEFELLDENTIKELVKPPECYAENVEKVLEQYNALAPYIQNYMAKQKRQSIIELDGNLPPKTLFEGLLETLKQMSVKKPVVPYQLDYWSEHETKDEPDWENILNTFSGIQTIAPLFRWQYSRWLNRCPVELMKGFVINGKPSKAVVFLNKLYFLSSNEALELFLSNPRPFLLPPMPVHPVKFIVLGHPLSGRTPVCQIMSEKYNAKVIDFGKILDKYVKNVMDVIMFDVWLNAVCEAIEEIQVRETIQQAIHIESNRKIMLEEKARIKTIEKIAELKLTEDIKKRKKDHREDEKRLADNKDPKEKIIMSLTSSMDILLLRWKRKMYATAFNLPFDSTPSTFDMHPIEPPKKKFSKISIKTVDKLEDLTGIQKLLKDSYIETLVSQELNEEVNNELKEPEELVIDANHPEVASYVAEAEAAREREGLIVSTSEKMNLLLDAMNQLREDLIEEGMSESRDYAWIIDNFPAEAEMFSAIFEHNLVPSSVIVLQDVTENFDVVYPRFQDTMFQRIEYKDTASEMSLGELDEFDVGEPEEEEIADRSEFIDNGSEETIESEEIKEEIDHEEIYKSKLKQFDAFIEKLPKLMPSGDVVSIIKIKINRTLLSMQEDYLEHSLSEIIDDHPVELTEAMLTASCIMEHLFLSVYRISEGVDQHKMPREIAEEIFSQVEALFAYKVKEVDKQIQEQDEEDLNATTDLIHIDSDNASETQKEKILLQGDSIRFCPVHLKERWILYPCSHNIEAKYRGKTYRFSSIKAREKFKQNPTEYVAKHDRLMAPPLRLCITGPHGSGKSNRARKIAEKYDVFHIDFHERLQEIIFPKTGKKLGFPHQIDKEQIDQENAIMKTESQFQFLSSKITLQSGSVQNVGAKKELLIEGNLSHEEVDDKEKIIRDYLQFAVPVSDEILEMVLSPFWSEEPLRSTGFILDGFPNSVTEVEFLVKNGFFPDTVLLFQVEETTVVNKFISTCMTKWRVNKKMKLDKQIEQKKIAEEFRAATIAARRVELEEEKRQKNLTKPEEQVVQKVTSKPPKRKDNLSDEWVDDQPKSDENEELDEASQDIDEIINQEFPKLEDIEEEPEETEEEAMIRYTNNLAALHQTEEENLSLVQEKFEEFHIPFYILDTKGKQDLVSKNCFKIVDPWFLNRESVLERTCAITSDLAIKLITNGYKMQTKLGRRCPVQLHEGTILPPFYSEGIKPFPVIHRHHIYWLSSEETRTKFMQNPIKYLKKPFPKPITPLFIAVVGPSKAGKTTLAKRFERELHLVRLSAGDAVRYVLEKLYHTHMASLIYSYLHEGKEVPDWLLINAVEAATMQNKIQLGGMILDGFPLTIDQTKNMTYKRLVPICIFELKLPVEEVLLRNANNGTTKITNIPHHHSEEYIRVRYETTIQSLDAIRSLYQDTHHNWVILDATHSKWWIWRESVCLLKQSTRAVQDYLEKSSEGNAVAVSLLGIAREDIYSNFGIFGHYCPVSLAKDDDLVDCSHKTNFEFTVEFKGKYYNLSCLEYMEIFLNDPEAFLPPNAPRLPPPPNLRPFIIAKDALRSSMMLHLTFGGFCPVTYFEGCQTYESLIQGKSEISAMYRQNLYHFANEEKREKFLRKPEKYANLQLPFKKPPQKPTEPIDLMELPMLGYLEQNVSKILIKALTAVGKLKPKFPFLNPTESALLYLHLFLKANNPQLPLHICTNYHQRLVEFEEQCKILQDVCKQMMQSSFQSKQRPGDFSSKLQHIFSCRPSHLN